MKVAFSSQEFVEFFLSLSLVVGLSRIFGEALRKRGLPHVAGEILAGILLGETVLGRVLPGLFCRLFPSSGHVFVAFEGLKAISLVFLMFVAGSEVNLGSFVKQGKEVVVSGILSFIVPFSIGFASSHLFMRLFGCEGHPGYFPFFLGAAFSISSIPVIARVLVDLNILKSDVGSVILGASCINNLLGWVAFSIVLGAVSPSHRPFHLVFPAVVAFVVVSLTVGIKVVDHIIRFFQARMSWPASVVALSVVISLVGASTTEWLGIHSVLGAFVAGMVFGSSPRLKERTRDIVFGFVMSIFSPIFFGSIAIHVDFIRGFSPLLFLAVFAVSSFSMLSGGYLGARLGGMDRKSSVATAIGLNTRGAMEIILAIIAFQYGIIGGRFMVAFISVAVLTSLLVGPLLSKVLARKKRWDLMSLVDGGIVFARMDGGIPRDKLLKEMSSMASEFFGFDEDLVFRRVWERERLFSTGIGRGVAMPHARLEGIDRPCVVAVVLDRGVDFDAPDGVPARVVFLILTPQGNEASQLEIMGDIARLISKKGFVDKLLSVREEDDFLSLVKTSWGERA